MTVRAYGSKVRNTLAAGVCLTALLGLVSPVEAQQSQHDAANPAVKAQHPVHHGR